MNTQIQKNFSDWKAYNKSAKNLFSSWRAQGMTKKEVEQMMIGEFDCFLDFAGEGNSGATYPSIRSLATKLGDLPEVKYINSTTSGYGRYLKLNGLGSDCKALPVKEKPAEKVEEVVEEQAATDKEAPVEVSVVDERMESVKALYERLNDTMPGNVAKEWRASFQLLGEKLQAID